MNKNGWCSERGVSVVLGKTILIGTGTQWRSAAADFWLCVTLFFINYSVIIQSCFFFFKVCWVVNIKSDFKNSHLYKRQLVKFTRIESAVINSWTEWCVLGWFWLWVIVWKQSREPPWKVRLSHPPLLQPLLKVNMNKLGIDFGYVIIKTDVE